MCTSIRNGRCFFVPPYVLSNMAKAGVDISQLSIEQSRQSQVRRRDSARNMHDSSMTNTEIALPIIGQASREVYDCHNLWTNEPKDVQLIRSEGDAATADDAATHAYDYAGIVRNYYKTVLNRNSIDNRGLNLILNVHYGEKYMNAFWEDGKMTFGDGDQNTFINFANSKDVIGHELTHGVTECTANLLYEGQSGALNEHFSDVLGTAIKQHSNGQTAHDADWLIGNDIMGAKLFGEALRSVKAPGTAYDNSLMGKDRQPAHMKDFYAGPDDHQGVHINSGIPNKAFYLVAMEIGTDKTAQIWYHGLQNLRANAYFKDAVQVLVRSAQILTKSGDVPLGTTQTVRAAFKAVGL